MRVGGQLEGHHGGGISGGHLGKAVWVSNPMVQRNQMRDHTDREKLKKSRGFVARV